MGDVMLLLPDGFVLFQPVEPGNLGHLISWSSSVPVVAGPFQHQHQAVRRLPGKPQPPHGQQLCSQS